MSAEEENRAQRFKKKIWASTTRRTLTIQTLIAIRFKMSSNTFFVVLENTKKWFCQLKGQVIYYLIKKRVMHKQVLSVLDAISCLVSNKNYEFLIVLFYFKSITPCFFLIVSFCFSAVFCYSPSISSFLLYVHPVPAPATPTLTCYLSSFRCLFFLFIFCVKFILLVQQIPNASVLPAVADYELYKPTPAVCASLRILNPVSFSHFSFCSNKIIISYDLWSSSAFLDSNSFVTEIIPQNSHAISTSIRSFVNN